MSDVEHSFFTGLPYRGFIIRQVGHTNYVILQGRSFVSRLGTYWSCVCYIDERLQR